MSFLLRALCVFSLALLSSALWALYFRYASARRAALAASVDTLLIAASSAIVLAYVNDWRLLAVDLVGSWLGTFLTIRHSKPAARA